MRPEAVSLILLLMLAGCLGGGAGQTYEPEPRRDPVDDGPPEATILWDSVWQNGTQRLPPGPSGDLFEAYTIITIVGEGSSVSLDANLTSSVAVRLSILPAASTGWTVEVVERGFGLSEDAARAQTEAMETDWLSEEKGTKLSIRTEFDDVNQTGSNERGSITVRWQVPTERFLELAAYSDAPPSFGPAIEVDASEVCMPNLALTVNESPLEARISPWCEGVLSFRSGGTDMTILLEDAVDAGYFGGATSAGGRVEVELEGVEFDSSTEAEKIFWTSGWRDRRAPTTLMAEAEGGEIVIQGCEYWACPSNGMDEG